MLLVGPHQGAPPGKSLRADTITPDGVIPNTPALNIAGRILTVSVERARPVRISVVHWVLVVWCVCIENQEDGRNPSPKEKQDKEG